MLACAHTNIPTRTHIRPSCDWKTKNTNQQTKNSPPTVMVIEKMLQSTCAGTHLWLNYKVAS